MKATTCLQCSSEFTIKWYKQKYCSYNCSNLAKTKFVIKVCPQCNKEFEPNDNRQKFCSHSCVAKTYNTGVSRYKPKRKIESIDWKSIQQYYNEGHTTRECSVQFKIPIGMMPQAVKLGLLILRSPKGWSEFLIENCSRASQRGDLKKWLLKHNHTKNECAICHIKPLWQDKKLVLVLDHINGINNDCRLENLRLLCPNCNSQTDTFSGRNLKNPNHKKRLNKQYLKPKYYGDFGAVASIPDCESGDDSSILSLLPQ